MAVPLIVLAILSFIGGFMNVPGALGGSTWLADYLSPVFHSDLAGVYHLDHATEYILMASVVGLTVIVIAVAYLNFVKKKKVPLEDGQLRGAASMVYHKYYVDEIYDRTVVRPLHGFARIADDVIEKLALDRLINSLGQLITGSSNVLRKVQNGSIGFYIFVMVLSIIVILTLTTVAEL